MAAQIPSYYIPKNLKEVLTGPEKEYWLAAYKKQLGNDYGIFEDHWFRENEAICDGLRLVKKGFATCGVA